MDCFAKLGIARAVWLDPDAVQQRFLELSAHAHPDKAAPEARAEAEREFTAINHAAQTLRQTRARIVHLLELEGAPPAPHVRNVPAGALELFTPVAELTRKADALLKEKASSNSPMLQVQFFEKALGCADEIQTFQKRVREKIGAAEAELRGIELPLDEARRKRVEEIAALLGFLERWHAQLSERATSLTF